MSRALDALGKRETALVGMRRALVDMRALVGMAGL